MQVAREHVQPRDISLTNVVKLAMATQLGVYTSGLCCDAKISYSIEPDFPLHPALTSPEILAMKWNAHTHPVLPI